MITVISIVLSFIFFVAESLFIIHIKGYETIDFGGIKPFINVWAMHFFFVYSILMQIRNWYYRKAETKEQE